MERGEAAEDRSAAGVGGEGQSHKLGQHLHNKVFASQCIGASGKLEVGHDEGNKRQVGGGEERKVAVE